MISQTKIKPFDEIEGQQTTKKRIWTSILFAVALVLIIVLDLLLQKVFFDEPEFKSIEETNKHLSEFIRKATILFSKTGGGPTVALYVIILSIWYK